MRGQRYAALRGVRQARAPDGSPIQSDLQRPLTFIASTGFDLVAYNLGGPDAPSLPAVSTNFGVGGTALLLSDVGGGFGGAQYFLFQQLYNSNWLNYPGRWYGAISDLGGLLENASQNGVP
jgi:hypothetical protein